MEIRDGWMIGRGVADDKGPMVATLYALKFLKEEGVSLRYPIRALVGDNEETHMHDVDYYLANPGVRGASALCENFRPHHGDDLLRQRLSLCRPRGQVRHLYPFCSANARANAASKRTESAS